MPRRLLPNQNRGMAPKKTDTAFVKKSTMKIRSDASKSTTKAPKKIDVDNGVSDNDEEEYVVEKILAVRTAKFGRKEFKVKWRGYSESESTWEPRANLNNCGEVLREFEAEEATKNGESSGLSNRGKKSSLNQSKRMNTANALDDLEESGTNGNKKKRQLEKPQTDKDKRSSSNARISPWSKVSNSSDNSEQSGHASTPMSHSKKGRRRLFTPDVEDVIEIKEEKPESPAHSEPEKKQDAHEKAAAAQASTKRTIEEDDGEHKSEGRQLRSDNKAKPKEAETDQSNKEPRHSTVPKPKANDDEPGNPTREAQSVRKRGDDDKKKEHEGEPNFKRKKEDEDGGHEDNEPSAVPTKILCATRQEISKNKFNVQYAVELGIPSFVGRRNNNPTYVIWRSDRLFAANPRLIVDYWEKSAYWPKCQADTNEILHGDGANAAMEDPLVPADRNGDDRESYGTGSFEAGRGEDGNEDSRSGNDDQKANGDGEPTGEKAQESEFGGDNDDGSGYNSANEDNVDEIEDDPPTDGFLPNGDSNDAGEDTGMGGEQSVFID